MALLAQSVSWRCCNSSPCLLSNNFNFPRERERGRFFWSPCTVSFFLNMESLQAVGVRFTDIILVLLHFNPAFLYFGGIHLICFMSHYHDCHSKINWEPFILMSHCAEMYCLHPNAKISCSQYKSFFRKHVNSSNDLCLHMMSMQISLLKYHNALAWSDCIINTTMSSTIILLFGKSHWFQVHRECVMVPKVLKKKGDIYHAWVYCWYLSSYNGAHDIAIIDK